MTEQLLRNYIREYTDKDICSGGLLQEYCGDFSLSDKKACDYCLNSSDCDRAVLNVHSDYAVDVLSVETWLSYFPANVLYKLKNCDYFISDGVEQYASKKIAFCDLTCLHDRYLTYGSHEYPYGKREYAVQQMINMADFFNSDELLGHYIQTATSRRFILGVRMKNADEADIAVKSMTGFLKTPSSQAPTLKSMQLIAGQRFEYNEVRHPAIFQW